MRVDLLRHIARALARPECAVAHVRCLMDNMGDRLLAETIARLLDRLVMVDYSPSRLLAAASLLAPGRRLFRFTCLGGGTLIFGDIDRGWGSALQHALPRTEAAFSVGTGVIDPEFRVALSRDHGLRPLAADSVDRWVELLHRFEIVTVRGDDSARLLRERGLERVEVVGDPAIVYARRSIVAKAQERRLGLNLTDRSYFFGNANGRVAPLAVRFIRRLRESGWKVMLYPMGPEDRRVTETVLAELGDPEVRVKGWSGPLLDHFDAIAEQDVFVGVRLHSTAAAVCTYTPAVMLAYQPKNVEFMATLGLGDCCLRIDRLEDEERLIALVEQLHDKAPEMQARQQEGCERFRSRLLGLRDRIHARIRG